MTWTFRPSIEQLQGGHRYLLLHYRAEGIAQTGDYLLTARDGSPDWRHYLTQRTVIADRSDHVIAVDLLGFLPPDNIEQLAVRLVPVSGGSAKLIARIGFSHELPDGAKAVGSTPANKKTARVEAESIELSAAPTWLPRNASREFEGVKSSTGWRLRAAGEGLGMRWTAVRPAPIDVRAMPYFAMRYRARGDLAAGGYVLQGYVTDAGGKRESAHIVVPRDLDVDGRWHVLRAPMPVCGKLESLAFGVDCGGGIPAELEIDWIAFQSEPFMLPVADEIDYGVRQSPWPSGHDGFETLAPPRRKGTGLGAVALARFGIGEWFPSRHITVDGVPFEVVEKVGEIAASGIIEEEALALDIPPVDGAKELLLLMTAAFPAREEFVHWKIKSPLRWLSEPERLVFVLEYEDGSREELLPIGGAKRAFGVGHGPGLYSIPLRDGPLPRRLLLRDRMRNSGFSIFGATLNRGSRHIPEPVALMPQYPKAASRVASSAEFRFSTQAGLAWGEIHSATLGGAIALTKEPVFSLQVGAREIPSTEWRVENQSSPEGEFRADCSWSGDGMALKARFNVRHVAPNSAILSLEMENAGKGSVTGALYFPRISNLALGSADDTWYLSGRTGCVINRLPCSWRDEIGETHPLQLDGFFNPRIGAGIAIMPRDTEGTFRWYHLGKDARGGRYALEFLPQTVAPGEKWKCVPVAVTVHSGDWRDQVALYKEWLATWYRPAAPRKSWFSRVFALPSYTPSEPFTRPLDERLNLAGQVDRIETALGCRDYIHLFGWAITPEHGHWGAYDEYHQLGGLPRFIAEVRKCQGAGVPVGVYLDGYLVSARAVRPDMAQREKWAVRRADGEMLYHENYDAHSMCPYVPGWREHLVQAYRRVAADVKPDGMYLDEFGRSMVGRICHAKDHPHPSPTGMSPGEGMLARVIRAAVPTNIALYCEYVPSDVMCQDLDGAFGHTALHGNRDGYEQFSPHYLNLQRFVQPDFKVFELIYYAPLKNGNWYLLKYPFFNGEGYYLTGSYPDAEPAAREFLRKAFDLLRAHADAFTSNDVEPLVPTKIAGLFANRFTGPKETVWTLFNANHRTLKGPLITVPHLPSTSYRDAWRGHAVQAAVNDGLAALSIEIGPRQVGCIVGARK